MLFIPSVKTKEKLNLHTSPTQNLFSYKTRVDYVYSNKEAQATWRCESVNNLDLENVGSSSDPTDHMAVRAAFKQHPEKHAPEKEGTGKKKKNKPHQKTKKQKQRSDKKTDSPRTKETTVDNEDSEQVEKDNPKKGPQKTTNVSSSLFCPSCKISCNSKSQYEDHMMGKYHRALTSNYTT